MESAAATALRSVLSRVHVAAERSGRSSEQVRIVAVSKTKSVSVIQQAYEAGHRVFGENYVQELVEKCPQSTVAIYTYFFINIAPQQLVPDSIDSVIFWDESISFLLRRLSLSIAAAELGHQPRSFSSDILFH
ncbi:hypothetical protein MA16_Dca001815 [Dendrobium catenatum]|uniref:Alanine racemase N-terminal domain-containing protein n=2 Tax=Dendrobium catenatum TaxID=906689 RepID=A0A2I0XDL2_9ASPA|nr:hypothetical protein MA16_Dca001815 [Dendrobium catenatum]